MSFTNEKVVEIKTCEQTGKQFEITDKDLEFYDKISPIFNGKKYSIPTPRLCPEARQQRRLSFRNERKLYKRKCDATGKDIISIYSPDKPYTVYNQDFWWSDNWDPMDYGLDFDFEKGFFEQFNILYMTVPKFSMFSFNSENSDYCAMGSYNKNCYLTVGSTGEDCLYGHYMENTKNCMDFFFSSSNDNCYEVIDATGNYKVFFSQNIQNCSDSYFLFNCKNVKNCILCTNLKNKEFCIENKQYSKTEYFEILKQMNLEDCKEKFQLIKLDSICKSSCTINSTDSLGDNISDTTTSKMIFDSCGGNQGIKNVSYVNLVTSLYDSYDITDSGDNGHLLYEINTGNGSKNLFNNFVLESNNILYSIDCEGISNCFGCIGLRNKQYCIFNKQYSKEEYNILVPKIIQHMQKTGEWGEFFPSSISPFGYNETVAQEYFPITLLKFDTPPSIPPLPGEGSNNFPPVRGKYPKGDGGMKTIQEGTFKWSSYEAPLPKVDKIIPANKLPENIGDIPDDIFNWAIECEVTKKPFRIIPQELEFYRKHKLPIPKRHPDQRHMDRMKLRNPRKLFTRNCDKCGIEMQTTYSSDRPETVYCEECYNKEFY